MKKILSHSITFITEVVALLVGTGWFLSSTDKYEPAIMLIISGGSFITTWILRMNQAEEIPQIENQHNHYEYNQDIPLWERITRDIGFMDLIDRFKEKSKHEDVEINDYRHGLDIEAEHLPHDIPDIREELLSSIDNLSLDLDISLDGQGDLDTDIDGRDILDNLT